MDTLLDLDKQLLLLLNGSDNLFFDNAFCVITRTTTWLPLALVVLYVMMKNLRLRRFLFFVLTVALLLFVTDRVSSGLIKPYFHRLRPTHDPSLASLVDVCRGYRGGLFGFFSSHAANTFGLCTFVSLVLRDRRCTVTLVLWAMLASYSRLYLGVHYPGDILCGMAFGIVAGLVLYQLYVFLGRFCEPAKQYYSTQYTSSGFLVSDCLLIPATFVGTLVIVAIWALW